MGLQNDTCCYLVGNYRPRNGTDSGNAMASFGNRLTKSCRNADY